MIEVNIDSLKTKIEVERLIGSYSGEKTKPTLVFLAGIHGNETSGLYALKKVFNKIKKENIPIEGNVIALSGNLAALKNGERFSEIDLNRIWNHERIEKIKSNNISTSPDEKEMMEIYLQVKSILENYEKPFYFIDLHTTSSKTTPFITISDSINNRRFSSQFPVPIVLGIEEYLDGPFLSYINEFGHIALGFEAGQHIDKQSIDNSEAFIWMCLGNTGCIKRNNINDYNSHTAILQKNSKLKRQFFEIDFRYEVSSKENFSMYDGFINFDKISKNQPLAKSDKKVVKSPFKGRIFMPLYQNKGDDGFFVIAKISVFWLVFSTFLRKMHFHNFLRLLPGIKQSPENKFTLIVNHKTAKFLATDIFHLFGYRKKIVKGDKLMFIKRDRRISNL